MGIALPFACWFVLEWDIKRQPFGYRNNCFLFLFGSQQRKLSTEPRMEKLQQVEGERESPRWPWTCGDEGLLEALGRFWVKETDYRVWTLFWAWVLLPREQIPEPRAGHPYTWLSLLPTHSRMAWTIGFGYCKGLHFFFLSWKGLSWILSWPPTYYAAGEWPWTCDSLCSSSRLAPPCLVYTGLESKPKILYLPGKHQSLLQGPISAPEFLS